VGTKLQAVNWQCYLTNIGTRHQKSQEHQYLVCPPPAATTATQRRLMLQISLRITHRGILAHSCWSACARSRTFSTSWLSLTWRPKWSHRCSIGEISGDLAGHGSTWKLFRHRASWVYLAVCGRALSCWNSVTSCCLIMAQQQVRWFRRSTFVTWDFKPR